MTSPVEAGFAPAGKRFRIIGAVDEVSPFPVANSPETTPYEAADEIIWLRPKACVRAYFSFAQPMAPRGHSSAQIPHPLQWS
jgi:hypothetical protein